MSTLLYLLMWQIEAPLWGWAIASVVIGLGFTFFSGATEAWLVDALHETGFTGDLESVFARGQVVAGVAVLVGSVGGGFIAQMTNLGVPYLLRAALLGVTVLVALWRMHDLGFSPERRGGPVMEVRRMIHATVEVGWRQRPIRMVMLAAPFTMGVAIYAFYAMQPHLLELYGDETAFGVAGLAAAAVGGSQVVGGLLVPYVRRLFKRRTGLLIFAEVVGVVALTGIGITSSFALALGLFIAWAARLGVLAADAPGVHQPPDPGPTAGDGAVRRRSDGVSRRGGRPARPRSGGRRRRLRRLVCRVRRDHRPGHPVPGSGAPGEGGIRPDRGGWAGARGAADLSGRLLVSSGGT